MNLAIFRDTAIFIYLFIYLNMREIFNFVPESL